MVLREILICIAFSLIIGTNASSDDSSGLETCVKKLFKGGNIHEIQMNPSLNSTELEYLCSHVDEFFQCYDEFDSENNKDSLLKLRKILAATFEFYCGSGRELYLKSHGCLNEEPAKSQLKECSIMLHHRELNGDICSAVKPITTCAGEAAEKCGEDSKAFIQGYFTHVITDVYNCDRLSPGVIVGIVCAVVTGIIIVVVIVLKKRKPNVPFEKLPS